MLPKITFADDSPADLQHQTAAAADYFSNFQPFAGFAIHYYDSYCRWLKLEARGRRSRE